jgi:hypothetical protein
MAEHVDPFQQVARERDRAYAMLAAAEDQWAGSGHTK